MNWDRENYDIAEISQNTEENPGNLKRLAVIHTTVNKKHYLTLVWKTRKEKK